MKVVYRWMFMILIVSLLWNVRAQDIQLDFKIPGQFFLHGSPFYLDLEMTNRGTNYSDAIVMVALNLGTSDYWFFPSWVKYPPLIDAQIRDIPGASISTENIIPGFVWPDGAGEFFDALFIAAVISSTGILVSDVPVVPFGWVSAPVLDSIDPSHGSPGKLLKLKGRGLNLPSGEVSVEFNSYSFPIISSGVDLDGIEFVTTVIPPLDPATYNITLVAGNTQSNILTISIEELASTGKPKGQVLTEVSEGMNFLVTNMKLQIIPEAVAQGLISPEAQADYIATMDRAETIFNTFFTEIGTLPLDQQDYLESILAQNGLDTIFSDLTKESADWPAQAQLDVGGKACLSLDMTSACLTAIDKAWDLVDIATIIGVILSGGSGLPAAAGSWGAHLAVKILDSALDGFFPTDLKTIQLNGAPEILSTEVGQSVTYRIQGVFDNQKPPSSATFDVLLSLFIEKMGSFMSQTEVDDALRNWLVEKLSGMGISLGEGIMGTDMMQWGDPDPVTFDLDLEFYQHSNMRDLLLTSIFSGSESILDLLNLLNMGNLPASGVFVGDTSLLTCVLFQNTLVITGLKTGTTSLMLNAFAFSVSDAWWNVLGLEIPGSIVLLKELVVSDTENPTPTPPPIPTNFMDIPAGTFLMGSSSEELCDLPRESPQHTVTISKGFGIMNREVTQQQWVDIFGINPSYHEGMNRPVETVNWIEACIYCNRLSSAAGLTPAYYNEATFQTVLDGTPPVYNSRPVFWNKETDGFRLPTEAEWEYACRAGTTAPYNNGQVNTVCDGSDPNLDPIAWYSRTSDTGDGMQTHDVGLKIPNNWNIYDMHGNVWELCWDYYGENYYQSSPAEDPTGPDTGDNRIWRGGAYNYEPQYCRSASRGGILPTTRWNYLGFRVVRPVRSNVLTSSLDLHGS